MTDFESELKSHLETWGTNCGAPLSVYAGHLQRLLLAALRDRDHTISELERIIERRCWFPPAKGKS